MSIFHNKIKFISPSFQKMLLNTKVVEHREQDKFQVDQQIKET